MAGLMDQQGAAGMSVARVLAQSHVGPWAAALMPPGPFAWPWASWVPAGVAWPPRGQRSCRSRTRPGGRSATGRTVCSDPTNRSVKYERWRGGGDT
jgi:hypothetical protein